MDRNAEEASSREGLLQAYNNDEKKSTAAHQTREETAESYLSSDESDVDIAEYLKQDRPDDRSKTAPFKHKLNFYTGWKFHYAILAACIISFAAVVTRRFWVHDKAIEYGQSPPWYPSPAGGTVSQWTESYEKAAALVEKMSLPEKINITTGTGWQMGLAVGNTGPAINVGFPALAYQDGPLGLRFADNATAFPAGITVGSTWNKEIMYKRGSAHGLEARLKGVNVLLGPCVGPLGRMPAGGRNWEGFGSDPYLQGVAAAETIKGIQDQHVIATIKHFIGNEQEHFRQARESGLVNALSSNIDDRTLHEIYGWPFQDSVKAGVGSLMCSYQMLNNSYACSNSKLLNGILKDEYGFQGFVQSDWLAQRAGMASALAGLDVTMPGDGQEWANGKSFWGPELTKGVLNGSIPIQRLNDMVTRVVAAWYQMGQDDESYFDRKGPNFSSWTYDEIGIVNFGSPDDKDETIVNQFINVQGTGDDAHSIIARRVATEGTVLVKNDGGILPLSKDGWPSDRDSILRVGVFGEDAGEGNGPNYCVDRGCNQGTLGSGWGSGAVDFPYLVSPLSALKKAFNKERVDVNEYPNNTLSREVVAALPDQDICLVFANADAGEGYMASNKVSGDRNDLYLQKGGDALILEVANGCGGNTVVIVHSVGPVILEKWIDHPNVKAVIMAHLPGEESGNAIADILLGNENPSGKLPYTIGKSLDDYGPGAKILYTSSNLSPQQNYSEGLYIDYRYFDKYDIQPRAEFGFGLSYTTFQYTNIIITPLLPKSALPAPRPNTLPPPDLGEVVPDPSTALFPVNFRKLGKFVYPYIEKVSDVKPGKYPYPEGYDIKQPLSQAGGDEGGNPDLWNVYATVSVDVQNTGPASGKEVAQLYLSYDKVSGDAAVVDFPVRVLRGFEKVFLEKSETQTVSFNLTRRDLSYWDVVQQNWVLPTEGKITINVGASSRDLRLVGWY